MSAKMPRQLRGWVRSATSSTHNLACQRAFPKEDRAAAVETVIAFATRLLEELRSGVEPPFVRPETRK